MNAIGTPRWSIPTQSWVEPDHIAEAGKMLECPAIEQEGPSRASDEVLRLGGSDPGKSAPSHCTHDFFAVKGGHLCIWCGLKVETEEP